MVSATERGKTESQQERGHLTLRVRIFRKGENWYAECIDLSLITRRPTADDALKALYEQALVYLNDAWQSGDWNEVVPRPASWRRHFWYYLAAALDFARHIIGRSLEGTTYKVPIDSQGHLLGTCA